MMSSLLLCMVLSINVHRSADVLEAGGDCKIGRERERKD